MSVVGLITEYNPFHKGHLYHIEKAKILTASDTVIAVMSGNFVQRGEPAVMDKYTRTQTALDNGVDLVAELPVYYACSSAESFAFGGVMTLHNLGADYLCFGSECGDIDALTFIASVLSNEPASLSLYIKELTAEGLTYPAARSRALIRYFKESPKIISGCSPAMSYNYIEEILTNPNNILGIEYIKVILKYNLKIKPVTIRRIGGGYHDKDMNTSVPSASAIRALFASKNAENRNTDELLRNSLPSNVTERIKSIQNISFPVTADDLSVLLNTILKKILFTDASVLLTYKDVTPNLANRIENIFTGYDSFTEFCMKLKNKQWTYTRISRCLIHILLEITDEKAKLYESKIPYIRLLGIDKKGRKLLSDRKKIMKESKIPIITKTADYQVLLKDDIYASDIYNMVIYGKFGSELKDEFRKGMIVNIENTD